MPGRHKQERMVERVSLCQEINKNNTHLYPKGTLSLFIIILVTTQVFWHNVSLVWIGRKIYKIITIRKFLFFTSSYTSTIYLSNQPNLYHYLLLPPRLFVAVNINNVKYKNKISYTNCLCISSFNHT